MLFLDLDGFKGVNDRFGHAEGDELLKVVSARLAACVRAGDSVARLGGDEFAVLVEGVDDVAELDDLCERVLRSLRAEVRHPRPRGRGRARASGWPSPTPTTTRPGCCATPTWRCTAPRPWARTATSSTSRRCARRTSAASSWSRRCAATSPPGWSCTTSRSSTWRPASVQGLEALVRWQRPEGLLSPDVFIPAAEESGLIVELGEQVLRQVVADAEALQQAAGRALNLGCNMSAHQLRDPRFLDLVQSAVVALGDNQLVLEMTETVVVDHDDETDAALRRLTSVGARLAIDDFGVGFSSIGYLQHLPVDILKIDRSFTRDVDSSPRAAALVEAILVMGSALDLRVVAEGIERVGQASRLRQAGCQVGQGFLYGRPAAAGRDDPPAGGRVQLAPVRGAYSSGTVVPTVT